MKDKNTMKRMEAMMKAFEKVLQAQKEEKEKETCSREKKGYEDEFCDDGEDLFEEILSEIADHLEEAADLCYEALGLYRGDDEALGCACPDCIMMEVHSYDDL